MRVPSSFPAVTCGLVLAAGCPAQTDPAAAVTPRPHLGDEPAVAWEFAAGADGWHAVHDTRVEVEGGQMDVECTGGDPYLIGPPIRLAGPLVVRLRMRCRGAGGGQVFWTSAEDPGWNEVQSASFGLRHDGEWREAEVVLDHPVTFTCLRLDPGTGPGRVEVDWIRVLHRRLHPLQVTAVRFAGPEVEATVRNHGPVSRQVQCGGDRAVIPAAAEHRFRLPVPAGVPFPRVLVNVATAGLPDLLRVVTGARPGLLERPPEPRRLRAGAAELWLAGDGSGAVLRCGGRAVATVAPLALGVDGGWQVEGTTLRAGGTRVRIGVSAEWFTFDIDSDREVEGPVVRPIGSLQQGLFSGIEYLGRDERSSSTVDIETREHLRYRPDPLRVTMPLAACVTDRGATALVWRDPGLRASYAVPDFVDGHRDPRMSVSGRKLQAAILVRGADPEGLDPLLLAAVRRHGLPPLPRPPRDDAAQRRLCLTALRGSLWDGSGWGHCLEPRWERRPYADMASTVWRLTGRLPLLPEGTGLVAGGAHVANDAAYFIAPESGPDLRERVEGWLAARRAAVREVQAEQQDDGSFRYSGRYRRGHFEDTASGYCGAKAATLLEFAWLTGDGPSRAAGLRALQFAGRFRTPRGAQTWELALHTPDILAAAHLVRAHVRAWQLTGGAEHLEQARRWALRGLPFVYLWSRRPVMAYATVPVFGATNWREPNWIGLPVQWCGGVYAYALALLAPHDHALDWHHIARGILTAAEQMQYVEGPGAGCLPDFYSLPEQQGAGPTINPCALVSLRLALAGELDSLAVATDRGRRVTAPFPVRIRGDRAIVEGRAGQHYALLVDGERVVPVTSGGRDEVVCWGPR